MKESPNGGSFEELMGTSHPKKVHDYMPRNKRDLEVQKQEQEIVNTL
jgi:hypothetical protein